PGCAGVRPLLVLLREPLCLARAVREHRHDVSLARELDRGSDRLDVTLSTPHGKAAAGVDDELERPPVELGFRHEPQDSPRPQRHRERPWVEIGRVIGRKYETPALGEIFLTLGTESIQPVEDGPADHADEHVEGARPHAGKYPSPGESGIARYGVLNGQDTRHRREAVCRT